MVKKIPFLKKTADYVQKNYSEKFSETLIIFPNHRSIVIFKKYLINTFVSNSWLPQMITIDDFMVKLSGLEVMDPLLIELELYNIHLELEKEHARSIDEFMGWASIMLNDFSDIDYNLIDESSLFNELSDIKAIEKWNPDGTPLTSLQQKYLSFFKSLKVYYNKLKNSLLEKGYAYKALAYRYAAENLDLSKMNALPWNYFISIGFNALTPSELKIFKFLKENTSFEYLIDGDNYFYDKKNNFPGKETGKFLRNAIDTLNISNPKWLENNLLTSEKKIETVAIPGNIGQVQYASSKLFDWVNIGDTDYKDICIVLADEGLLIPLLDNVPVENVSGKKIQYNVTLGYPLSEGAFYDLIQQWFIFLDKRFIKKNTKIDIYDILLLLKNPLLKSLCGVEIDSVYDILDDYINNPESKIYQEDTELSNLKWLISLFQSNISNTNDFFSVLKKLFKKIGQIPEIKENKNSLIAQQWYLLFSTLNRINEILTPFNTNLSIKVIQKIIISELKRQKINLKGEPVKGIQIMGLLETRNIDFEKIIIIGANEGILPQKQFKESFIPFDLKKSYNIPLPQTSQKIFSYHFYRLLQRANEINISYNSEPGILGGGEPSRFILQVKNELSKINSKIKVNDKVIFPSLNKNNINTDFKIHRNNEVDKKLKVYSESGISPSAINDFLKCPLKFYLQHIMRISPPDEMQTNIESNIFGKVVHGVLEAIYKPMIGQPVDVKIIREKKRILPALINIEFEKYYQNINVDYGRDLLIIKVITEYLSRFLDNEIRNHKNQIVKGVEIPLKYPFAVDKHKIYLKGFIDRVDEINIGKEKVLQIIDYKTGKVDESYLKINDWDKVKINTNYDKALQILIYAWLYYKYKKPDCNITAGLISLRTKNSRISNVTIDKEIYLNKNWEEFDTFLKPVLKEIFFGDKPFDQTNDTTHCKYCDFKNLCDR